jgi:hypothetical protein
LEQFAYLKPLTDEHHDNVRIENNKVADHRSLLLLYARMFIFRVFLETASEVPGGITENHKRQWLFIQVAPDTLLARPDVFWGLTLSAGGSDRGFLKEAIQTDLAIVMSLLPESTALFCVLDEAQVPTNMFLDCFLSQTEPAQPRPILHEIILAWRLTVPDLIVSGTGVSMREMETVLGSVVAKEGDLAPTMTDVGGFENEADQRAYLEQYLPPAFLDTQLGEEVASRAGYWLRGRFVCSASV